MSPIVDGPGWTTTDTLLSKILDTLNEIRDDQRAISGGRAKSPVPQPIFNNVYRTGFERD